jgi:hypothetical protein
MTETRVGDVRSESGDTLSATTGGGTSVSDAVYGAAWDGVTTIAPSKNAVYDKIELLPRGEFHLTFFCDAVPTAIV